MIETQLLILLGQNYTLLSFSLNWNQILSKF